MSFVRSILVAVALCSVGCTVAPVPIVGSSSSSSGATGSDDNNANAVDTTPCDLSYEEPADKGSVDCTGKKNFGGGVFKGGDMDVSNEGPVLSDGSKTILVMTVPFDGTESIGQTYTFQNGSPGNGGANATKWSAMLQTASENGTTTLYDCAGGDDQPATNVVVTYTSIDNVSNADVVYKNHGSVTATLKCSSTSPQGDTVDLGMTGKITLTF